MNNEDLFKDALPMDEKKYQIFVSSTYTDLIGAREAVATTILRLYHVPIGMEMFSAGDDKQWKIISETISASDYYIVIIGHRYGSETPEGISFTEKEYDYAKEKNIPVLAFIRQRDVATKPEERDDTSDKNKKLDAFIAKVSDNQMCDYWKSSEELTTKVSVALHKVFKKIPRIGWVRAENVTIMEELGKEDFFAKHNIYETVRDILWKESIDITSKKNTLDFTISELESFCHVYYPDKPVEDIKTKVRKARAAAFEGKYANRTKEDDERFIDINSWRSEFKNLFSILNINNLHNLKIINVGIGNGLEGEEIFENMPQFTGVDISNKALTYAKQRFPNINKIMNDAEDLNDVDNSSQDVYISLRTFQSTLFDIKAALNQAFRVIKPNGKIIVSISHTFKRKEDNKLIKGLLIPGSNKVDPGLPYSLSVKVWKELNALKFSNIRINQGMVENYIYGQKTK